MRTWLGRTEMQAFDEVVDFVVAAGDEGEGEDLSLGEENEGGLMHSQLGGLFCDVVGRVTGGTVCGRAGGAERLGEIGADELARVDLDILGITLGFETFCGRQLGEWGEIVFGFFEAGIGGGGLGGDDNRGVDGRSGGIGWALEDGKKDLAQRGWFVLGG